MTAAPATLESPPPAELAIVGDFLAEEERLGLLRWARAMRPYLKPNGPHRFFRRVEGLPRVDPLHTAVRLRLQRALGVPEDAEPEPCFGWYLSIVHAGGFVHAHTDPTPEGMRHLRANIFLQMPYHGGRPVIGRAAHQVAPRTLLAFFPSERRHMAEPSYGRRRRIILSFGYLVPGDYELPAALTGAA